MIFRRSFLTLLVSFAALAAPVSAGAKIAQNRKLPNIVWITSEDHGPHLGCYGDKFARTPNLDAFAKKGLRFARAWSNAPVCAPARTAIISGIYPPSTGSQHMRSGTILPRDMRMFVVYLRQLGYYCTNKVKEDYNLSKDGKVWDDSSNKAHWKNRQPGQPFFAVFNSTKSHESGIRNRYGKKEPKSDVKKVPLPPYHPDTPVVRRDWAFYYDTLAEVDADAAKVLRELEEAGLLEDTIVFYYADHGSGMPRNKRTPLNCGLQVPMIVHFPAAFRHLAPADYKEGGVSDRLVSFVDLAPTVLSIAGREPPAWMQGKAFAGKYATKPPPYIHGFRGRMDERYDFQRSVTDGRYVYLRNYMPHLPAGQHVEYMFVTKTSQVWKKLFDEGKLNKQQSFFFETPRTPEELYDLTNDPHEVNNLAPSAKHQEILQKLRQANREHLLAIRDLGFLPEDEIHRRSEGSTPYTMGHDAEKYPLKRIMPVAELASSLQEKAVPDLAAALRGDDSAVRYWGALGLLMRGKAAVVPHQKLLTAALKDDCPSVRVVAAEALARFAGKDLQPTGLNHLLELAHPKKNSVFVSLAALNALDRLGEQARPGLEQIRSWPTQAPPGRSSYGIPRLINRLREQLK